MTNILKLWDVLWCKTHNTLTSIYSFTYTLIDQINIKILTNEEGATYDSIIFKR